MKKIYQFMVVFVACFITVTSTAQITVQGVPRTEVSTPKHLKKPAQKDANFTFDDIQYWVGEGEKKAALVVQWNDTKTPDALVWGYKFDGDKKGIDMLLEIAKVDPRFYLLVMEGTQYGSAIGGIGYDLDGKGTVALVKNGNTTYPVYPKDGKIVTDSYDFDDWTALDPNDHWVSGWYTGYFSYWIKDDNNGFSYSGVGASSRELVDGSWDVWNFYAGMNEFDLATTFTAVPALAPPITEFTKGFFMVNEEWFGHTNGSVNFISEDGRVVYRPYSTVNNNEAFGATTQFGTIYGDNFYFVSKQHQDGGDTNYTPGGRLVVADAKTLVKKAGFDVIGGGDGRSFLGVNPKTGYIGAANGIFLFDIENLKVGALIEGTGGGSSYAGQIGNMIRTSQLVFAVKQSKGVLVIDPTTHRVIHTLAGAYSSIVQAKDGSIWAALKNKLVKIDPSTFATEEVAIPTTNVGESWGAWNAGSLTYSNQENALYYITGAGWGLGKDIVRFDVETKTFNEKFAEIPGQRDENGTPLPNKQIPYGSALRIDPLNGNLILNTTESGYGSHYQKNWVHTFNKDSELINTLELQDYYWFPAVTVFPDNEPAVISNELKDEYFVSDVLTIDLKDKVSDKDNLSAAIVKTLTIVDNQDVAKIELTANEELVIHPLLNGTAKIEVHFTSNGKVTTKAMTFKTSRLGTGDIHKTTSDVYPNPFTNELVLESKEIQMVEIYSVTGQKVAEAHAKQGKNVLQLNHLKQGVYILKANNQTYKLIKK